MPSLLMHSHLRWSRHELPDETGVAVLRTGVAMPIAVGADQVADLPPDAIGLVVVVGSDAYHISLPDLASAYHSTESTPCLAVVRLRDRDRVTYHLDGQVFRLWYTRDGQSSHFCTGAPAGLACGYCLSPLLAGDEIVTCTCGEILHADCLDHSKRHCARCGVELPRSQEAWLPEGFTEEENGW